MLLYASHTPLAPVGKIPGSGERFEKYIRSLFLTIRRVGVSPMRLYNLRATRSNANMQKPLYVRMLLFLYIL